jgi:O-acetyl-ADP-ribose deacetylase (regulator of RNase III)
LAVGIYVWAQVLRLRTMGFHESVGDLRVLKNLTGDILLSKAQVIAHGVAPNDHFNQGLAHSLREQYPAMAKDFRHYCSLASPKPGEIWAWAGADGRRIVNLMTQEEAQTKNAKPGKATLHNVNVALRNLKHLAEQEGFKSIALPRLATGVGGLDWAEVHGLIENQLSDLDIPVFVYARFERQVAAEE